MTLQLFNSLTKKVELFTPLNSESVTIYSCGPTVYDHVHIGNLSAFITADILRRVIAANNFAVKHVMNFTDVDDKTIKRSKEEYPQLDPREALRQSTETYGSLFLDDMTTVGNDTGALTFIKATDEPVIGGMRQLIQELLDKKFAYIADDGIYFSIESYRAAGKTYGQLIELTASNTSSERIQNDEYDKESVHDFALWKKQKDSEPSWEFIVDGKDMSGRPGWHIECSVMSRQGLGQPFDIHTGGIDLTFPHHENEIAQSTAVGDSPVYAATFVHNEHILVDGKKMSKSLGNFYTLTDLADKHVDPLAFRLLVLQSHYRKQTQFSLENVEAAGNRLRNWRNVAALRHQAHGTLTSDTQKSTDDRTVSLYATSQAIVEALSDDLNTPAALRVIDEAIGRITDTPLSLIHRNSLVALFQTIDDTLGLHLLDSTPDISDEQKQLLLERQQAREEKSWTRSDELRDTLLDQHIAVRDTPGGPIWEYIG